MIFRREIGEKGQVVVPADIRRMLNLKKGGELIFEVKENNILLKTSQSPAEFLEDFFNIEKLEKSINMKGIKKIILDRNYDKVL